MIISECNCINPSAIGYGTKVTLGPGGTLSYQCALCGGMVGGFINKEKLERDFTAAEKESLEIFDRALREIKNDH